MKFTYIGGPTALLQLGGLGFLTDPTFDPAGEYRTKEYTLRKLAGPAIGADSLGRIDAVLLSHDQHIDNLDHSGRTVLPRAGKVLTTRAGAERLGSNAMGLGPWERVDLPAPDGRVVRVTGTPARHGPHNGDRGPVTGFVLSAVSESSQGAIYVSGDTVWYEGVAEVSRRFDIRIAVLFMGAASVPEVGPAHLTFTAAEAIEAARAFSSALIVPLHYEGWGHYTESRQRIEQVFKDAGMDRRLRLMQAGIATELAVDEFRSP
ncbi:MAG: MBL fold metallo-hydrolase [Desulfobacteraceae bacterium]|nr:MBL fold metallo-hydrolase [Desulfobacteraceae bacterium]